MKNGKQTMKRLLSLVMAFAMIITLLPATVLAADTTKTIYLKAGVWDQAGAWFDAWVWGSSDTGKWYKFSDADGDLVYKIDVPADSTGMKLVRMSPSYSEPSWNTDNGLWNQTGDLTIADQNCYSITGWGENTNVCPGSWSNYDPSTASVILTVAGDSALCGAKWAVDNTANDMTKNADGLYEKVFTEIAEGTYEFKVAADHAWTLSWGDTSRENGNAAVTVEEDGSTVTITFNTITREISATVEKPADDSETKYYVMGNAGLCGADGYLDTTKPMELNSDGKYELTYSNVPAGSHYFWITDGTNEGDTKVNGEKVTFTLDAASNVTIVYDADAKTATHTAVAVDDSTDSTITVYFRNDWLWPEVNVHYWNDSQGTKWPGVSMTKVGTASTDDGDRDVYSAEIPTWATGIVFNGTKNDDSSVTQQTVNITSGIVDGSGFYIVYDGDDTNTTDNYGTFTYNTSTEKVTYEATFHFANTLNWSTVNLYTWIGSTTYSGGWPGSAMTLEKGYYTKTVTYEAAAGQGLNFIFNNGSAQTVDLSLAADAFTLTDGVYKAEKWAVLTTQTEEKYNCAVVDSAEAIVTSPEVAGSSVTFRYGDSSAEKVYVAGSFNGWSTTGTTAIPMTKDANGVWSATVENLTAGEYQYKFVVNGDTWIIDPMNSNIVTEESGNQNSAFYILSDDETTDNDTVTIKIHYKRDDGKYDGWNLWVWSSTQSGHQVDFAEELVDGAKVATIVLENARAHQDISFKERLSVDGNDWKEQGSSDRSIDLSTIVAGTIDYYIASGSCVYGTDVVRKNKISSVSLDYDNGVFAVTAVQTIANPETALKLIKGKGDAAEEIAVTITAVGSQYYLELPDSVSLDLAELYLYKIKFGGYTYSIGIDEVYASAKFAAEYTYTGTDLGANYTSAGTTFNVWAPTATAVSVNLYTSGTAGTEDLIKCVTMTKGEKGVWSVTVEGNLNGTYYTYAVTVDGETVEAVDPYARTTGVNGNRGMVIDLDATDPEGWANDTNPNKIESYTDAVIYELHVRDFSIDDSSGVSEANRGKYLAFTEKNTKTTNGATTGISYLADLGVTHVHLLPVYDYGSVDETTCSNFNWGYDPVNYNVPEGSYSTNPYNGAVRVSEFKQMVKSLHDNGISVIMDVVYNHVYDADKFCFNNIVPSYFSRKDSNGSGCGNDTASEREMVRKYIVESVVYWAEEYHIDGFRFDLVGLLDATTINEIVNTVHEQVGEDIIFYGEGWTLGTNVEPGNTMATQANSSSTPNFAYFSDTMRNLLGGNNGQSTGYVSGSTGREGEIVANFMANPGWTSNPTQVVQYASCHDNYTLVDKLVISTGATGVTDNIIKMNNLAAAIYMTSQGIPFIHAGEEMLREKLDQNGNRSENSYNASDYVNHIEWSNLEKDTYVANSAYYKGLIAFRKAHPSLSLATSGEVNSVVYNQQASDNVVSFWIDSEKVTGEEVDSIYVIFNANRSSRTINLPAGDWDVCINGTKAGTETIETVSGSVTVAGISAMVLTQKDSTEEPKPTTSNVALPGSFNSWNQGNYMSLTDTDGIVTQTLSLPAGTYEFKIKIGDSWYGNSGTIEDTTTTTSSVGWEMSTDVGDNCKLRATGGAYTFTFNTSTNMLVITYDPNGGDFGDPNEYYLYGYINGADYATGFETGDYKFVDGKLTTTFTSDSYVAVKNGDSSATYWTEGYLGNVTSATLYNTKKVTLNKADKLLVPGGVKVTFTLTVNDDNTVTLSYEMATSDTSYSANDTSGIQDGVTLHCWNWSFKQIEANMATIAAQGYTAIQTSPVQPIKEATSTKTVGSHWWVYYQPVDFVITTDEGNALGTKEDLESMIKTAHNYGIQVIVDVVANHLANQTGNNLSTEIPDYLRNDEYWHDITTNITNWADRYNMTQYCMSGLPDLNTKNDNIQGYVLAFLKKCIDIGVDGFRFDAAKSIETPKDDSSFASDFWPTVIGGAEAYAEETYDKDIYVYGEVLDNPAIAISAYTEYMAVTDNSWGNSLRSSIAGGTAAISEGYHKSADASQLVIWAESHDTYATDDASQSSAGVSEANINKTWALVAARADAMGLYLARPESTTQLLGVASATGWANAEVKAVNKFHNAFAGETETIGNSGNISYVVRGTTGIVLVNASGTTTTVSGLDVGMTDGNYTDQITGKTFTVTDGKISGDIGSTGIAVVYNPAKPVTLSAIEGACGSEIQFWMKVIIPESLLDDEGAYVVITKDGGYGKVEKKIMVAELKAEGADENGRYKLIMGIASGEMTNAISYQFFDGKGKAQQIVTAAGVEWGTKATYSFADYVNNVMRGTDAAQKKLITAMVTYGGYAQTYFSKHGATNVNPNNPIYNELDKYDGYSVLSLDGVTADSITQSSVIENGGIGITATSMQTFADSEMYLRVYFTVEDGYDIDSYTFQVDGVAADTGIDSSGRCYVQIPIPAAYMDSGYKITVTDGTGTYSITTSVLVWIKNVLKSSSDADQINLVKAAYLYNKAANEFFGK